MVLWATKKILGREFLLAYHTFQENTRSSAMFLVMILYMGVPKTWDKKLCQMVFIHAMLGEIDEALDNVNDNLMMSLPQNYYMSLGNRVEVKKFPVVRSLNPVRLEKLWDEKEQSIMFLLKAAKMMKTPPKGWVQQYLVEEWLARKVVADDDGDWELGMGEEWVPNDSRDLEAKVSSPTHVNYGLDCPVIANYMAYMKWVETEEEEDNEDEDEEQGKAL